MSSNARLEEVYLRWLLERVLIHGWTTLKCAKEVRADPEEVLQDFELALKRYRGKGGGTRNAPQ